MLLPHSSTGLLFGRRGETIQQLQQEANCKISVDRRAHAQGEVHPVRSVSIRSTCPKPAEREMLLARCARIVQLLCDGEAYGQCSLSDAITRVDAEMATEAAVLRESEELMYQEQMVRQVTIAVGDSFSEATIREALAEEHWSPDHAQERLFQMAQRPKPALDVQKLLEASRAANKARKAMPTSALNPSSDDDDASSSASTEAPQDHNSAPVSKHVQAIRDVFASIRRY